MRKASVLQVVVLGVLVTPAAAAAAQQIGPNPQETFKQLDSNGDGKISLEELPAAQRTVLQRLVKAGDRDKDGALNQEEFSVVLEYRDLILPDGGAGDGPLGQPPFDPQRMWQAMDRNQDGKVTLEEAPERAKPLILGLLRRAGKEPSDSLSADEFSKLLSRGPLPGDQAGGFRAALILLRRLDADRDDKISKGELAKALEKFDELDANKDGGLDPSELLGQATGGPGLIDRLAVPQPQRTTNSQRGQEGQSERAQEQRQPLRGGEFIKRLFEKLDRDGDGKLSPDEATDRLKENFSKVDANGDGAITAEELKSAIPKAGTR